MKKDSLLYLYWALFVIIIICLFYITHSAIFLSDDLLYSIKWGETCRVQGFIDAVQSQIRHYNDWCGRFVVLTLLQYILSFDKIVYDILNTLCYILSVYLICKISKETNILSILFVSLTYWIVLPYYTWTSGSLTYMWSSCIVLLFLNTLLNVTSKLRYFAIPLALLAGDSHEILGCGLLVVLTFLLLTEKHYRKDAVYHASCVFVLAGFLAAVLCPGVPKRLACTVVSLPDVSFAERFFISLLSDIYDFVRLIITTRTLYIPYYVLIIISVISISLYLIMKKNRHHFFFALVLASMAAATIPFAAHAIYRASLHGLFFYSFVAVCVFVLPKLPSLQRRYVLPILGLLICCNVTQLMNQQRLHESEKEYEDYIVSRVKSGVHTVVIPQELRNCMGAGGFRNFHSILQNRASQHYYGIHEFCVLKNEQEAEIYSDESLFSDITPGMVHPIGKSAYIVQLREVPKAVKGTSTSGESSSVSGVKGWFLSKGNHKYVQSISPAIFEKEGKIYLLRCAHEDGEDNLLITYADGSEEQYTIK